MPDPRMSGGEQTHFDRSEQSTTWWMCSNRSAALSEGASYRCISFDARAFRVELFFNSEFNIKFEIRFQKVKNYN